MGCLGVLGACFNTPFCCTGAYIIGVFEKTAVKKNTTRSYLLNGRRPQMSLRHPPPPFPFLNRREAYEHWNLYGSGVTISEDEDANEDRLLDFWLRVQARGCKRWSMQPSQSWNQQERFQINVLRVDFESRIRIFIYYLLPLINDTPMLMDGGEGRGLFVLELPLISAYCPTVSEAIAAIDSVSSYIPTLILRRDESLDRSFLQSQLLRVRKLLVSNCVECDDVMVASLDRRISRLEEDNEHEQAGFVW